MQDPDLKPHFKYSKKDSLLDDTKHVFLIHMTLSFGSLSIYSKLGILANVADWTNRRPAIQLVEIGSMMDPTDWILGQAIPAAKRRWID